MPDTFFDGHASLSALSVVDVAPVDRVSSGRSRLLRCSLARAGVMIADLLAVQIALAIGLFLRVTVADTFPIAISSRHYIEVAVSLLAVPVALQALGLYGLSAISPIRRFTQRIQATLAVFALMIAWDRIVLDGAWSRGLLLAALPVALVLPQILSATAQRLFIQLGWWGIPAIIVGAGTCGRQIARTLTTRPEFGLTPIAFFDDDPAKRFAAINGVRIVGEVSEAGRWTAAARVAVVCLPSADAHRQAQVATSLGFPQVLIVPDFVDLQTLWLQPTDLGGLVGLVIRNNLLLRRNRAIKRILDVMIAVPALILVTPFLLFFAAWIRMTSSGTPFFGHIRPGRYGEPVRVWKLRTMYQDASARLAVHVANDPAAAEEWERFFKLRHDPRVLPWVGTLLRKSSLDELPQLWNVVRGDMSLVGPRPFPQYHLDRFSPGFQALRMSVLPGITGLWQVTSRSDGDVLVQEAEDTYYIRNWSIWMDLYIVAVTPLAVLSARGAR